MKYFLYSLLFFPALCFAKFCQTPWEDVSSPVAHVKMCRMSVPHGWLVFSFAVEDMEIPHSLFYPDENHEWLN